MSKNNKKKHKKEERDDNDLKKLTKKELLHRAKKFSEQYCVGDDKNFTLKGKPTSYAIENDNISVRKTLKMGVKALAAMQDILYAQDKWSVLIIFQAMDAAGKDGAIKHVMSGINPQGCQVSSFKGPSSEELDHDYLWRCQKHLPERGRIGIFNRSYYEEVLVVRVHEQILRGQKLPEKLITKDIWDNRFEDIRNFEKYLSRNGTVVIKFFLNVSKEEQKEDLLKELIIQIKTGNSVQPMPKSEAIGMIICMRMRN